MRHLTADDLLAGATRTHVVEVPAHLSAGAQGVVELRPLTLKDVDQIRKAARDQRGLTSVLMVQQALVSPRLALDQVGALSAGLVEFLLKQINEISGLALDEEDLDRAVKAPLARACFVLARSFGWTPAQVSELTMGQVLLYLEMLARHGEGEEA